MDPLRVVRLTGDALDRTRQRVQQDMLGHRGHAGDPLYGVRRAPHTGANFLTDKQQTRRNAVVAVEERVEVEATCGIYQRIVADYREPHKARNGLRRLCRTLKQRAAYILAFFGRPGTKRLRRSALDFRNPPTTSRDRCSKPEDSDPLYTLVCDESLNSAVVRDCLRWPNAL